MPCQLPYDCLHYIFEFLEKDKVTLHSCLLVNRLWCEASVRILWRNNDDSSQVLCLPNESKTLLLNNGISSKPPLFNYASFYKVLQICIYYSELKTQEIFKMFMNQTSLKKLLYYPCFNIPNFTQFPGARNCLTGLSKLICKSNINSEFCYQLSQICHNIQSITVEFDYEISNGLNGLKHLISSQNSLKCLSIIQRHNNHEKFWVVIAPLLIICSKTLIKLKIKVYFSQIFNFKELQHITFPQIQILKLRGEFLGYKNYIKFLEIHGKNLKEFCVTYCDDSVNLAIAKFCPNLKSLHTHIHYEHTLEVIFHSCERLEKIGIRIESTRIIVKQVLNTVAKHSPKNFQDLELLDYVTLKDLESFFVGWRNHIPRKPLTIIGAKCFWRDEEMKIIEKYKKLGTIKKFEVVDHWQCRECHKISFTSQPKKSFKIILYK